MILVHIHNNILFQLYIYYIVYIINYLSINVKRILVRVTLEYG